MLTTSLSAKNGEDVCRIKENPVDPFFPFVQAEILAQYKPTIDKKTLITELKRSDKLASEAAILLAPPPFRSLPRHCCGHTQHHRLHLNQLAVATDHAVSAIASLSHTL